MSREKQIEEMAKVCTDKCKECHNEDCRKSTQSQHCIAETLYNAGYRKQSENAAELPCKVGKTIYLPWEFEGIKSIAYLTVTHIIFDREKNYVVTDFKTDDESYYGKYKYGKYEFEDFGKIVFLTREEAEAKMKGGE